LRCSINEFVSSIRQSVQNGRSKSENTPFCTQFDWHRGASFADEIVESGPGLVKNPEGNQVCDEIPI